MQAFMYLQSIENQADLPKLIITDMYLPGITRKEFLTDLKKMGKNKGIHVVVLASVKTPKEVERYRQMGADDYLITPSTYDEYVEVARSLAEKLFKA